MIHGFFGAVVFDSDRGRAAVAEASAALRGALS
jgi:hypothetical protein